VEALTVFGVALFVAETLSSNIIDRYALGNTLIDENRK
jgi:hypothetical protein